MLGSFRRRLGTLIGGWVKIDRSHQGEESDADGVA